MRKPLPDQHHTATKYSMLGRFTSLLIFFGLLFSVVVAPVMAHASDHRSLYGSESVDIQEADDAQHKHSQGSDKNMPCHAVSHHHCGAALPFDTPRIGLSGLSKAMLMRPAVTLPPVSHSQAPPLDPPLA